MAPNPGTFSAAACELVEMQRCNSCQRTFGALFTLKSNSTFTRFSKSLGEKFRQCMNDMFRKSSLFDEDLLVPILLVRFTCQISLLSSTSEPNGKFFLCSLLQNLSSLEYDKLTTKALQIMLDHFRVERRLLEISQHSQVQMEISHGRNANYSKIENCILKVIYFSDPDFSWRQSHPAGNPSLDASPQKDGGCEDQ